MALLNETEIGMAGQSIVFGDAIGLAIKLFENTDTDNRVLIVLTDGIIIAFFKFFKKKARADHGSHQSNDETMCFRMSSYGLR
jgi:hypothetical protein